MMEMEEHLIYFLLMMRRKKMKCIFVALYAESLQNIAYNKLISILVALTAV